MLHPIRHPLCSPLSLALTAGAAQGDDAAAKKELAPTGKLRVGLAVGPTPGAGNVARDEASGGYRGVASDLGVELAQPGGALRGARRVPRLVDHLRSGARGVGRDQRGRAEQDQTRRRQDSPGEREQRPRVARKHLRSSGAEGLGGRHTEALPIGLGETA